MRFDTQNPPGNEYLVTDFVKSVLEKEGIPVQIFASDPKRPNLVARLKGNGKKPPLLYMGHSDVVTVDPKKWTFPPFSATRDGGYIYGRGSLDDKPHVVAGLMTLLTLKRLNVPLDRDVIFLVESGEEGTTGVGIGYMTEPARRRDCRGVLPRRSRHAPRASAAKSTTPLSDDRKASPADGAGRDRPLGTRVAAAAGQRRRPPRRRRRRGRQVARADPPECDDDRVLQTHGGHLARSRRRRDIARCSIRDPPPPPRPTAYFAEHAAGYASMLRTSISPTMIEGGYRINVIPSEARATLDVRMLPDENPDQFLAAMTRVINDPAVVARYVNDAGVARPSGRPARLDSEAFRRHSVRRRAATTTRSRFR